MEILIVLLILLAVTRIFGELAERVGQPALVGELIAGILLGLIVHAYPETFPAFSELGEDPAFVAITDLGVFFLMLLAGIEMKPGQLTEGSGRSLQVAIGGMLLPLAIGMGFGWIVIPESPYRFAQILFLGTALAITAVPVAVKILMDLGSLDSRAGQTIVAAAIVDDILSLILLAVLTTFIREGEMPGVGSILLVAGRVGLFFAITIPLGWFVFPRIGRWIKAMRAPEFELTVLLVAAMGFALLAEALHMHFIMGAFVAGVFFGRRTVDKEVYERVNKQVSGITTGFLAPIFFASIGLHLDLSAITTAPVFLVALLVLAFGGKLLGAALPSRAAGLSWRESWAVGSGMSGRGAVELIIAGIALEAGLFAHPDPPGPIVKSLFASVVLMAILTTAATPILLRLTMGARDD